MMKRNLLVLLLCAFCLGVSAQSAITLSESGREAENNGNFDQALGYFLKAKDAFASEGAAESEKAADNMHYLARTFANLKRTDESRQYGEQALALREKLYGKKSPQYIATLNNYAITYNIDGDNNKAMEIQREVVRLIDQLPEPLDGADMYWLNMGRYSYLCENYPEAAKYCELSLGATKKFSDIYEMDLKILGIVYMELGDSQAQSRIMALTDELNENELKKDCNEPNCMLERALYHSYKGRYAQAKECYTALFAMEMDQPTKIKAYNQYATFLYDSEKDAKTASEYMYSAAKIQKELYGESDAWANTLYQAALFAFLGKDYEKAIEIYPSLIEYYSSKTTPEAIKKAVECKNGLSNAYCAVKDYDKAIPLRKDVYEYYKNQNDRPQQAKALANLATAEKFSSHYDDAIEHYLQALEIYEEIGDIEAYRDVTNSLNLCYAYAGKPMSAEYDEAAANAQRDNKLDDIINEETQLLDTYQKYLGNLTYAESLATIAGCYHLKEDFPNAVKYYELYMPAIREAMRDEFRLRNAAGREMVWEPHKEVYEEILDVMVGLPEDCQHLYPQLSAMVYDEALLSKGMLLNSSIAFEDVLADSSEELRNLYAETQKLEGEIQNLRETADSEEDLDQLLALMRKSEELHLKLMQGCAEYADFTNYISYDWHDVQTALPANGVAVEFCVVSESSALDQFKLLIAVVLFKDMATPIAVPIADMLTIKNIEQSEDLYINPEYAKLFWGQLMPVLTPESKIFFSAVGPLTRMGIEYLNFDGKPFNQVFDVYRLSSTKELCHKRKTHQMDNAVVIGNINYFEEGDVKASDMKAIAKMRRQDLEDEFDNLDETLREVQGIEAELKKSKMSKVLTLQDDHATEETFKALSGKNVNLLHIATHGAYMGDEKQSDQQSMLNSILAFAGANLGGDEDADGLITAADVAKMNLRSCDLVVLSACETALGKLNDDGVFGLQRGFKNAGVGTLLMSTKGVYDDSTADLMIQFYTNLTKGESKREALKNAQEYLRANGYDDPVYWAPFILLDALD